VSGSGLPDGIISNQKLQSKFWRVLQWKMLVYFMAIWSILRPCGIFLVIWYIFSCFGLFTKKNMATLVRIGGIFAFLGDYSLCTGRF
jgi:hypothetical protein